MYDVEHEITMIKLSTVVGHPALILAPLLDSTDAYHVHVANIRHADGCIYTPCLFLP